MENNILISNNIDKMTNEDFPSLENQLQEMHDKLIWKKNIDSKV